MPYELLASTTFNRVDRVTGNTDIILLPVNIASRPNVLTVGCVRRRADRNSEVKKVGLQVTTNIIFPDDL